MGHASTYAVLAATTITNSGFTKITGDLGLYSGSSITGFPPATVDGTKNIANPAALLAQNDLTTARNEAAGRPSNQLVGPAVGGLTLSPGVYTSSSDLEVTGTLTLDCQFRLTPVWIFQIASIFNVPNGGSVEFINQNLLGVEPKVWWNAGSSATIGTTASVVGTIMAYASVSVGTGSTTGPLLANNGGVTLLTNVVKV
eukprot:gene40334-49881_t